MSWKDNARKRVKEKEEGGRFKLGTGANTFRILPDKKNLPYRDDGPAPYREVLFHREVGPDRASTRCGRDVEGRGSCWLCEVVIPKLEASKASAKQARAFAMHPQDQFVYQVSRFDGDTESFGAPQVFYAPTGGGRSVAVRLLSMLANSKRSLDHPKKGYCVTIERRGTGPRDTRYEAPERDEEPTVVPKTTLSKMQNLDEAVAQYSVAAQKSAYYGKPIEHYQSTEEEEPEESKDEDAEDAEDKGAFEDDVEEEEDAEDAEEPEEDEDAEEPEEDEDEDEDEDEEDEDEDEEPEDEDEEPEDVDEEDDEEDEDEEPEDDEDVDEEDDEEDEPPPSKKRKPAKKATRSAVKRTAVVKKKAPAKKAPTKKKAPAKKATKRPAGKRTRGR